MLQQDFHQLVQTILGSDVDRRLPLGVLRVRLGSVLDQKHGCGLTRLLGSTVEEGASGARVEDVRVSPSCYELSSKGVIILADVVAREVGRVQLLQRQPEGTLPSIVVEVKVQAENRVHEII